MEIKVKEFQQSEFKYEIDKIIEQLRDKDCQRVEFLRGMLAAYKHLYESNGWVKKQRENYFT